MEQNANQLEDWINQFGDYLYSWAHFRLSDDHLAKDLVQDTFLAAIQSFAHFEGRSSIKTWLTSILNNKIRDHFRKQKNRNFSLEDMAGERPVDEYFDENGSWKPEFRPSLNQPDEAQLLDQPRFREVYYQCIEGLSQRFRNVIVGKYLETKESSEICKELNISPSNFWQILHRAKMQLRNCLDVNWFRLEK